MKRFGFKQCKSFFGRQQTRNLNVHEYQGKQLMGEYNVAHQRGLVIHDAKDAKETGKKVQELYGTEPLIVKAQILSGGRGKGYFDTGYKGGVKFCPTLDSVEEASEAMLGNRLITKQTDAKGTQVNTIMITECLDFDEEYYFALLLDRETGGPVIVASKEGGMDIETVAEENPDAIVSVPINVNNGVTDADVQTVAQAYGLEGEQVTKCSELMTNLYKMFVDTDCTQLEINPLVVTDDGNLVCVDGKVNIDDNARFRQAKLFNEADMSEHDPREVEAEKYDLQYVGLDGNIGCLVNGAGLAMATMDIIQLYGGEPANFLDVGGSASVEQIENAFKIITNDENVQCILVNIFGGIMRCDVVAEGIVAAAKNLNLQVPLVVRLSGTNHEQGKTILDQSGLAIISAEDLNDAAEKSVATLH